MYIGPYISFVCDVKREWVGYSSHHWVVPQSNRALLSCHTKKVPVI